MNYSKIIGYRILHQAVSVETERVTWYMVLIEMIDDTPIGTYIIPYPEWLDFIDSDFEYYQINRN